MAISSVIKYVNLGLSNGMKIEHHNLSYSGLQSFISKLQDYVFSLNSNVKNKYIPNYQIFKRVTKLN